VVVGWDDLVRDSSDRAATASGEVRAVGKTLGLVFLFRWLTALRDYRSWRLEQVVLATAFLLGPDEAMLAGETSLSDPHMTRGSVHDQHRRRTPE
jgi:hypothetical protein